MRTLVICGLMHHAQVVYRHLDGQLRQRAADVTLSLTGLVSHETAHLVRDGGGELWFCGPMVQPQCGVPACRYLLADTDDELRAKADAFLTEYLGKRQVAA